ncbi:hypothetical protein R5W24_006625, partial [Gemmata sp. JC717]|uniref:hypothetical protein n=1 Tax=Gemmata algarum TaxID=2975278 RepID=UPI0021BB472B
IVRHPEDTRLVKLSEGEWTACRDDPATLLEHLGYSGWHTTRKFRLFCCAAARSAARHAELSVAELLCVAEADAEGVADPADLAKALARVEEYMHPANNRLRRRRHGWFKAHRWRWNAVYATFLALDPSRQANEWRSAVSIARLETWPPNEPTEVELSARVALVRDIFECPFRPPSCRVDPRRLTDTAITLARGIAADQAFDRLPILADALQESDCEDPEVLTHCRGCSQHVRGCWVVDLVLGLGVALYAEPGAAPDTAG